MPVDTFSSLSANETHFSITTSGSAVNTTSGSALGATTMRLAMYSATADFIAGLTTTSASSGAYFPSGQLWVLRVQPAADNILNVQTPTTTGTIQVTEWKS